MSDMLEARMRDVEDTLARIETKLDTALTNINDHEARLRLLEGVGGRRWDGAIMATVAAVIGAVIGALITSLTK